MKRILLGVALLMVALSASAQVLNPLTRGAIGGIPECKDSRVFCVGKQAGVEYSTICGMTPGTGGTNSCGDATDTCTSTSALGAAASAGCTVATPCAILVGRGVYNECVHFDNITDVSLIGDGDSTLIRPTVTASTDVANGVIRIGATTTTRASTARIEIAHLKVHNDGFGAPEAAIQVGKDAGPGVGTVAPWQDVYIHDVVAIGAHDAIQWFGSRLTTDDAPPRIRIFNTTAISGADPYTAKGWSIFDVRDATAVSWTNYCESTNTTFLAVRGPSAVSSNGGGGDDLNMAVADDVSIDRFYIGRKVVTVDNGGAGSCGATGNADGEFWIFDYAEAGNVATVRPIPTEDFTTGCNYTIAGVKHNDGTDYVAGDAIDSPCTDIDWSVARDDPGGGDDYWKNTWFHFGTGNASTPVPDSANGQVNNLRGITYVNDFGPATANACGSQAHVSGVLAYLSAWQQATFTDVSGEINVNVDLIDDIACTNPISGIAVTGNARFEDHMLVRNASIIINNRGDADENVVCVSAESTVTSPLRVDNVYCDRNNTVGGYAGTSVDLAQSGTSTLTVGNVTSDTPVLISGTIGHLNEMGAGLTGSAALDFNFGGAADQGTCLAAQTITVTGAVINDLVRWNLPNASHIAGVEWKVWVSATNTVSVLPCCITAADCADTPSGTWSVRIEKP